MWNASRGENLQHLMQSFNSVVTAKLNIRQEKLIFLTDIFSWSVIRATSPVIFLIQFLFLLQALLLLSQMRIYERWPMTSATPRTASLHSVWFGILNWGVWWRGSLIIQQWIFPLSHKTWWVTNWRSHQHFSLILHKMKYEGCEPVKD